MLYIVDVISLNGKFLIEREVKATSCEISNNGDLLLFTEGEPPIIFASGMWYSVNYPKTRKATEIVGEN